MIMEKDECLTSNSSGLYLLYMLSGSHMHLLISFMYLLGK